MTIGANNITLFLFRMTSLSLIQINDTGFLPLWNLSMINAQA